MARKIDRDESGTFGGERTMAAAEEDARLSRASGETRCLCGAGTLVLQAFFEVAGGHLQEGPIELDTLTCPECGREYEAVQAQDGRILRGELQDQLNLDELDES